jgi:nucleotide-binding universal stress UspA family protein
MQKRFNALNSRKHLRRGDIGYVTPYSSTSVRSGTVTRADAKPSTPLRRILVLIDPHRAEVDFLLYALRFAQPQQTEVHLAMLGGVNVPGTLAFGPAHRMNSNLCELARRLGHEVVGHRIPSDTDPALELRRLAVSREIEVMFMVTQGGPGLLSAFLKSMHERIVRLSPCPVVSVPEDALCESTEGTAAPWPVRTILTSVRFPQRTSGDLRLAGVLASYFAARVDLLVVQEHVQPVTERTDQRQDRAVRKLELKQQIAGLAAQAIPGPVRGRNLTRLGVPFCQATLETASSLEPDLIAVGVPTRHWQVHARVDRATERVLRGAARPVLCVPEPESEPIASVKEHLTEVWHRDFKRTRAVRARSLV